MVERILRKLRPKDFANPEMISRLFRFVLHHAPTIRLLNRKMAKLRNEVRIKIKSRETVNIKKDISAHNLISATSKRKADGSSSINALPQQHSSLLFEDAFKHALDVFRVAISTSALMSTSKSSRLNKWTAYDMETWEKFGRFLNMEIWPAIGNIITNKKESDHQHWWKDGSPSDMNMKGSLGADFPSQNTERVAFLGDSARTSVITVLLTPDDLPELAFFRKLYRAHKMGTISNSKEILHQKHGKTLLFDHTRSYTQGINWIYAALDSKEHATPNNQHTTQQDNNATNI